MIDQEHHVIDSMRGERLDLTLQQRHAFDIDQRLRPAC
jgi:hypothetical protein